MKRKLIAALLLVTSNAFATGNSQIGTSEWKPSDAQSRGILYVVAKDGSIAMFLGEGDSDIESAFQNAVKKCVAKGNTRSACAKRNNFDFTIPTSLFAAE